jgi:two-component system, NtrC family, nitrogen regulation response regulator GlnG
LFREDLFFRLNVVPLRIPPLRERSEDVPDLARHFLDRAIRDGLPRKDLSSEALRVLQTYRFPGNVRELENLIKRLLAMEVEDVIPAAAVERELADMPAAAASSVSNSVSQNLAEAVENHMSTYFAGFGNHLPPPGLYERVLAEIEPPLLRAALTATHGNQLKAADLLGINRNTLRSKLRERKIVPIRGLA